MRATSRAALCAVVALAAAALPAMAAAGQYQWYGGLAQDSVERQIDLTGQVEEVRVAATVRNGGGEAAAVYFVAVPAARAGHLSFYSAASAAGAPLDVKDARVAGAHGAPDGTRFLRVSLAEPLAAGATAEVSVHLVFTDTQRPLPAAIRQDDDQLVQYVDSVYFFSPYATATQKTEVLLASDHVESRTKKKPSKQSKRRISYGPYEDVPAYGASRLKVHFKNNGKFMRFTRVVRDIEVSHWGNVAVEEHVWVEHNGARLDGPFHRVTYEKRIGSQAAFDQLTATLPRKATDTYYRDYIGNISSSAVRRGRRETVMELTTRFPLFGGWKTDFYTGYNIPARELLSTDAARSDRYVLNTTFSTPFREAVVDDLTLRVILPEGASDIKLFVPFDVDSEDRAVRKTYLDTVGRPTVVFRKTNLVSYHDDYFQVVYVFPKRDMLIEPLMLSGIFFGLFAFTIFYGRLNLSLSPEKTD